MSCPKVYPAPLGEIPHPHLLTEENKYINVKRRRRKKGSNRLAIKNLPNHILFFKTRIVDIYYFKRKKGKKRRTGHLGQTKLNHT
jgi:hypothetical protein